MSLMTFGEIDNNGQYKVTIDLKSVLDEEQLQEFEENIRNIKEDEDFEEICNFNRGKLKYTSETLLPKKTGQHRRKVLFVLGNPATHSIKGKMFFFSAKNGRRHKFWGKLEGAGLLQNFCDGCKDRKKEADKRKDLILRGICNDNRFILGFTTFYSFPTPVEGTFKNVAGVEKLFRPIICKIKEGELKRIKKMPFSKNAILICTHKDSYDYITSCSLGKNIFKDVLYWPMFDKSKKNDKSSGKYLKKMLESCEKA